MPSAQMMYRGSGNSTEHNEYKIMPNKSLRFTILCTVIFGFQLGGWAIADEATTQDRSMIKVSDRALALHQSSLVIDGHNDLPWALRDKGGAFEKVDIAEHQEDMHTDIPRLLKGGIGAQFWSVFVPVSTMRNGTALSATLEQIDLVEKMCQKYPDQFEIALSTADIRRIHDEGKIASMIGVEGGHSIENSINVLRQLYNRGARYMTLTHSKSLDWADSCTGDAINNGLSPFGEEVVREMNRLGMLVDISHVSADCMRHTLRVTKAPVVFSHSSANAVAEHPRNVPDDVLKLTAENGGVVMVNFFTGFINPGETKIGLKRYKYYLKVNEKYPDDKEKVDALLTKFRAENPVELNCTAHVLLDHIEHIIKTAGIDHVGLGSDYDGISTLPAQLEDVSTYPIITQGLIDRGYSDEDIKKVLGENLMRAFAEAEKVAEQMK